jgi:hypothetical protein
VYFLCEVERLARLGLNAGEAPYPAGRKRSEHGPIENAVTHGAFPLSAALNHLIHTNSRAALGGDAGGRRATVPAVPRLVRAARAEGENLHSLRGVLDTAFPEIGGPVRAATHPALPSFPESIEATA